VFISLTQKNKYLLEPLRGKIYILSPDAFKYVIFRKKELFNLIDNYFNKYPSAKFTRLSLIKNFYELRPYRKINSDTLDQFNK
jgi:hypothetical protein